MAVLKHSSADAPRLLSDLLLVELDNRWCREAGILASCEDAVPMGAVLARNADGEYVPYMTKLADAVAASEGVEAKPAVYADKAVAVSISTLLDPCDEAQPCVVVCRGVCVAAANLHFGAGVTDTQKKTALGQLHALGIIPKE